MLLFHFKARVNDLCLESERTLDGLLVSSYLATLALLEIVVKGH